jgi:hypothetical protein
MVSIACTARVPSGGLLSGADVAFHPAPSRRRATGGTVQRDCVIAAVATGRQAMGRSRSGCLRRRTKRCRRGTGSAPSRPESLRWHLARADPSHRDDVVLLVTEVVTNAARRWRRTERALRVELQRWPRRVAVEVVGPGRQRHTGSHTPQEGPVGRPGPVSRRPDRRSLGVRHTASGACVWFEIRSEA